MREKRIIEDADAIYEHHADIFNDESLEEAILSELAARVMGREVRKINQRNDTLLSIQSGILRWFS